MSSDNSPEVLCNNCEYPIFADQGHCAVAAGPNEGRPRHEHTTACYVAGRRVNESQARRIAELERSRNEWKEAALSSGEWINLETGRPQRMEITFVNESEQEVVIAARGIKTVSMVAQPSPPPTPVYHAPIAKLIVTDGEILRATFYTPGLPDGEHDVYPEAGLTHWDKQRAPEPVAASSFCALCGGSGYVYLNHEQPLARCGCQPHETRDV